MIWATHEGPASAAAPSGQDAKEAAPRAEAYEPSQ